jgi:hypothetical protein
MAAVKTGNKGYKGSGLGLRVADRHRALYVKLCAGIDHIGYDGRCGSEERMGELWMLMHRCQNIIGDFLAQAVTGTHQPNRKNGRD